MAHLSAFDLDGTLLKCNCSFSFGVFLYKNKVIPFYKIPYLLSCYLLHKFNRLSLKGVHERVFAAIFKGNSCDLIEDFAQVFIKSHLYKMLNDEIFKELCKARSDGHSIAFLSSSPHFLVKLISLELKADFWFSSVYDVDRESNFSKILSVNTGDEKKHYLESLSKYLNIEIKNVTAYSDSIDDLKFLECAGVAIAVNPDRKLRKICEKNNWKIRK